MFPIICLKSVSRYKFKGNWSSLLLLLTEPLSWGQFANPEARCSGDLAFCLDHDYPGHSGIPEIQTENEGCAPTTQQKLQNIVSIAIDVSKP